MLGIFSRAKRLYFKNTYYFPDYGGKTETYRCKFVQKNEEAKIFYIDDKTSAYGSASLQNKFPVGTYEILKDADLENINFHTGQFYRETQLLCGVAQVRVFAPQTLFIPFLLYRSPRGVLSPLCKVCADEARFKPCRHGRMARSWIATYPLCEINYAAERGYTFEFFEIYQYTKEDYILKDFMSVLFHRRILLAGFPPHVVTNQEKEKYCSRINKEMNFEGPFRVTPALITSDKNRYMLYKNFMNEFVGKFGQKVFSSRTIFVTEHEQIRQIFFSDVEELEYIEAINDQYCELTVVSHKKTHMPSRTTNCIIAAYVTGYSRICIAKKMEEIIFSGGSIFYVSTDSICYSMPHQSVSPLCYGPCVNDFKQEYAGQIILSFYSVGPKETCVTYEDEMSNKKAAVKVKGLGLQNMDNFQLINPTILDDFLRTFLSNKYKYVVIPQIRHQSNKPLTPKQMVFMKFTNRTGARRVLLDIGDQNFTTLPLGFTFDMLKRYKK